jgi:16S rRNA (cytosine967-C5)-methyltransferase
VLPDENDKQISNFLAAHPDAEERQIDADWGRPCRHGRQILPGEDGMDGFFYAQLRRRA